MLEKYPDILTVKQLKEVLNIGQNKALDILHNGEIQHFRIGRSIKIPKKSVVDYIEKSIM